MVGNWDSEYTNNAANGCRGFLLPAGIFDNQSETFLPKILAIWALLPTFAVQIYQHG